ncbi:MAG: TNT domain-containing protein [Kibdelosporangium sp.]
MTQPTQLDPTEQDTLVKQIGLALLRAAPPEWQQVTVHYRAVGRYHEMTAELANENDEPRPWSVSPDLGALFGKLRAGMYRDGRGTWFNARYQLDRPSSYNLEYDREEPEWDNPPPPPAFPDELQLFPRDEENIPEWLTRRLAAPPPPPPQPLGPPPGAPPTPPGGFERARFRMARTFDGMGPQGRPVVNRPQIDELDTEAVLGYLDDAPLVMPSRGYDVDRLDPENRNSVPIAFHTDGTWIWPASVNYYLRTYGVSPEPDLVMHIRRHGFDLPDVDEEILAEAGAFVSRGAPLPPPGRPAGPPPSAPPPPPPPPPLPPPPPPAPVAAPTQPPTVPAVAAVPAPSQPGPALGAIRAKFAELGVPESAYRIGPPVERTWTLERVDDGWRVGWFERDQFVSPSHFEDVADASAFLLGKVLMDGARPEQPRVEAPEPPAVTAPPPPPLQTPTLQAPPVQPPQRPLSPPAPPPPLDDDDLAKTVMSLPSLSAMQEADEREPVSVPSAPPPEPPQQQHGTSTAMMPAPSRNNGTPDPSSTRPQDWPIQPLYGEPPLTLFRGKRMIELQPGTEFDRFGEGDGNLVYAVGTPFPLRSLVPDWVNREYHTYRVQQSFEALTGVAIPWFEQPGGGTAFLLPHAVEDMLEDGYLVEVPGRERPSLT